MNQAIHDYLIKLLTVMGGQMDHMPRVRNPPKKGEPEIKCDCNEDPIDRMSMKVSDRRDLIHEGHQLLQASKSQTVHIDCPFCTRWVEAGKYDDGECVVIHQAPACQYYERMNPLEFLTLVRKTYEVSAVVNDGSLRDAHEEDTAND